MRPHALVFLMSWLLARGTIAADNPTVYDLAGKWQGAVEFGKFKFSLVLRIAKTNEGRLQVTIDLPEQGQKDMPVSALLFNNPEVRLEIDAFGTAYSGKINSDITEINGQFEEGPGGRPAKVVFKRSTQPDAPEPEKVFTFAQGEAMDVRGYWKGGVEPFPGAKLTAGLNIGRINDGTFRATLDLPEQGAKDIPASSISETNGSMRLNWQVFQMFFDAKLSADGKKLTGDWVARGKTNATTFERLDAPLSLMPKDLSFVPDPGKNDDVRGYWKATLETPGGKLRLAFKIGRAPDGSYSGTLASLDQGGRELPVSSATFTPPKLLLEWKAIRGKYEGTLTNEGKIIDGKWQQMGDPTPLKLERTATFEGDKKS